MKNQKRILLIEDDPQFAEHFRQRILGAEIFVAENLKGAMELLRDLQFNIVVVDLSLPDWKRDPESMLTMIGMLANGAAIAAVTGYVKCLPERACNASAYKVNLVSTENILAFLREAEMNARKTPAFRRPIEALSRFVKHRGEAMIPAHA